VAEAVPSGLSVADVGAGDGQLASWLAGPGGHPRVVAIEPAEGPYSRARERLRSSPVEVRRGDGLAALRPGEVEAAVIAGMGGRRIAAILDRSPEVAARLRLLVLQPMQHGDELRERLRAGFRIESERRVEQGRRTYTVLLVTPREAG
jgi:tRNA (adenine22-N1)-methyltransferase